MEKRYPEYLKDLRRMTSKLRRELPGPMTGFGQLHEQAIADGALNAKAKELIALGIAIAVRCDGCIAFHVDAALRAGALRQEILETIGVAVLMGGGPAAVYGAEALKAVDELATAEGT